MAFNYAASKATAERLIANFGRSVPLTKLGVNTGTEWAPVYAAEVTNNVVAVEIEAEERLENVSLDTARRRKLLISTSAGITPAQGDKIVLDGISHKLGPIEPLNPGGTVLLWEATLED